MDTIGSQLQIDALQHKWGFTWVDHQGKSTALRSPAGSIWDIELMSPLTERLSGWERGDVTIQGIPLGLPTLDELYTLKLSHRYLKNSPHFMKTMLDIWKLREAGAKVFNAEWLAEREKLTYHYQHPNLKRTKDQFFTGDSVEYVYDHDALHQVVKLGDVPAYARFGSPGQEVLSSRQRFEALPELHRLHAVLEEAYVLAIERSQVPFPDTSPNVSFKTALEKVCTSITSGWFREYAWENYFVALAMYSPSYVEKFNAAKATLPHAVTPASEPARS